MLLLALKQVSQFQTSQSEIQLLAPFITRIQCHQQEHLLQMDLELGKHSAGTQPTTLLSELMPLRLLDWESAEL